MKRRHENTIEASPSSPSFHDARILVADDSLDAKATRQISKRRRVVGPDARNGLGRRSSALQDINNISHRSTVPSSNISISDCVDNQLPRVKVSNRHEPTSVLSRPTVPRPTSEPRSPPLRVSSSECHEKPERVLSSPASPRRSLTGPAVGSQPDTSKSIQFNSLPSRLIPQGKPVRIKQLQGFQHAESASRSQELNSDSEEEEEDEATDSEELDSLAEEPPEDSAERKVVENRYSEINKMLGDLFLSRHRGRA